MDKLIKRELDLDSIYIGIKEKFKESGINVSFLTGTPIYRKSSREQGDDYVTFLLLEKLGTARSEKGTFTLFKELETERTIWINSKGQVVDKKNASHHFSSFRHYHSLRELLEECKKIDRKYDAIFNLHEKQIINELAPTSLFRKKIITTNLQLINMYNQFIKFYLTVYGDPIKEEKIIESEAMYRRSNFKVIAGGKK